MKLEKKLVDLILQAPESQMDHSLFETIESWNMNPSAKDLLMILDRIVKYSLGSEFVVMMFDSLLRKAMEEENISSIEMLRLIG